MSTLPRFSVPLAELRGLPADPLNRVGVAEYALFPALNPNGRPLELCPDGYDMTRRQAEQLAFSPALVKGIYDALARAHVAARAKRHSQSREGCN